MKLNKDSGNVGFTKSGRLDGSERALGYVVKLKKDSGNAMLPNMDIAFCTLKIN